MHRNALFDAQDTTTWPAGPADASVVAEIWRIGWPDGHLGNGLVETFDHLPGADRKLKGFTLPRRIENRSVAQGTDIMDFRFFFSL